ncbi:MAG: hypothetical protein FWD61_02355 [Phycisphaerales bacterium]|nr:hypothetical protein [Phycisphaerales bacterium]
MMRRPADLSSNQNAQHKRYHARPSQNQNVSKEFRHRQIITSSFARCEQSRPAIAENNQEKKKVTELREYKKIANAANFLPGVGAVAVETA